MNENLYMENCIRTFTGQYVNVFEPRPETIRIEDIAHALSMQPRFGGHLPKFYSVAQHCVMVAMAVEGVYPSLALQALMHDASEAYLIDVPRPVKKGLANYKEIEDRLMAVIAEAFGFVYPLDLIVKQADLAQLVSEWDNIMIGTDNRTFLSQADAKSEFLYQFKRYS